QHRLFITRIRPFCQELLTDSLIEREDLRYCFSDTRTQLIGEDLYLQTHESRTRTNQVRSNDTQTNDVQKLSESDFSSDFTARDRSDRGGSSGNDNANNSNATTSRWPRLIPVDDPIRLEQFAFSDALSLSVKLSLLENRFDTVAVQMEPWIAKMKTGLGINFSQSSVLKKTGELFTLRHLLNISTSMIDTPDFYWDRPEVEALYSQLRSALSVCLLELDSVNRTYTLDSSTPSSFSLSFITVALHTQVLNSKLNMCCELTEILSNHLQSRHSSRLEWMIIALILVEVAFEAFYYYERRFERHPSVGDTARYSLISLVRQKTGELLSMYILNLTIYFFTLVFCCSAWPQPTVFVANTAEYIQSLLRPPTWLGTSSTSSSKTSVRVDDGDDVEVKHLTSAIYKGLNYILVKNLTLDFAEAEHFCAHEYSDPMHLVAVQSEEEWKMLTNIFGTPYPSEIWLGGLVQRSSSRIFVLRWLSGLSFTYHRFPTAERRRWQSNWRVNSQGCLVANIQSGGLGNWSAELTPCSEPRGFICKESERQSGSLNDFMQPYSPFGLHSLLNTLFSSHPLINRFVTREPLDAPREQTRHDASGHFRVFEVSNTPQHHTTEIPSFPSSETDQSLKEESSLTKSNESGEIGTFPEVLTTPMTTTESNQDIKSTTQLSTDTAVLRGRNIEPQITSTQAPSATGNEKRIEQGRRLRPTFTIYPVAPSISKNPMEKTVVKSPVAQVIFPQTLWDLTYPEEPKWLSEKH
ncbi:hypothetical protein AHF37_07566, partial [Paragonimus kellicotti]